MFVSADGTVPCDAATASLPSEDRRGIVGPGGLQAH